MAAMIGVAISLRVKTKHDAIRWIGVGKKKVRWA
jgi:hypothetical protein